jgi:hypothetical protein
MVFLSPGFLILSSKCSICGKEYGFCDHLIGLPYMGQLCAREITEMKIEEISIVPMPANKSARVRVMSLDGCMRNTMTWREEKETGQALLQE